MAMKAYTFPGAKREVYLPDWIQVEIRIVDHWNVRSYQRYTEQTRSTVHDTGNPRTNAWGEYSWLAGGRSGGEAGGYNWINDDSVLIITVPFNEKTWHAGTPEGNLTSWGGELAFGADVDWNTALDICCAAHAGVIEMQDLDPDVAAVLHQFWYGKYCSAQILNRGLWAFVKARITHYVTLARAARLGVPVIDPTPEFVAPVPVRMPDGALWDGSKDVVINGSKYEGQPLTTTTTAPLNMRQWAGTESLFTGPGYAAGDEVTILGWVAGELVDGISEWAITPEGHRLWAGALDFEPKADPEYGELPETPPGMVAVNGRLYYPLHDEVTGEIGRKITVHRPGNLRKWANTESEITGTVAEGDEVVFRYWTRGEVLPLVMADGAETTEGIWYAMDLHSGDRMWSGLSEERPD